MQQVKKSNLTIVLYRIIFTTIMVAWEATVTKDYQRLVWHQKVENSLRPIFGGQASCGLPLSLSFAKKGI